MQNHRRLANYSWVVLAYCIFVILFGAFVRATKSGAGCGAHWPLCNGVVIPREPAVETMIEFTHRLTSGIILILIGILIVWIWRTYPRGSFVRKSAVGIGFFIITESLIGAGLVLFEWVAHDDSMARAFAMMAHLVNTFLLLASMLITSWWLAFRTPESTVPTVDRQARLRGFVGVVGMLILGASGAITALGDTLFPATSFIEGFQQEMSATAHILLRLRIFHPFIAVVVSAYIAWFGLWLQGRQSTIASRRLAKSLVGLVVLQLLIGVVNVLLLAPVWLQMVHLFVTTLIWLNFVSLNILAWIPANLVSRVSEDPIHDRINQTAAG